MFNTNTTKNNKVKLVDSIMGSRKTTEIIKWVDRNPNKKYIFVSPLLSEVDEGGRVHQELSNVTLEVPSTNVVNKSEDLLDMIVNGCNIACTHSLYLGMDSRHFYQLSLKDYTVIIDEEVNVINGFNECSKDDLSWLLEKGDIEISEEDGMVSWVGGKDKITSSHKYYSLLQHCEAKALYSTRRSDTMMVSQLPIKLFEVAKEVIILTYMFDGNVLDCFLRLKGFDVEVFDEIECEQPSKGKIKELLTIIPPNKKVEKYSLSSAWWNSATNKQINDVSNYIRTNCIQRGLKGEDILFTVPKVRAIASRGKKLTLVKPRGYIQDKDGNPCFLAAQTRATNHYHNKKAMFHCYNRFPLQPVASYLHDYGYDIDQKVFATSEMLQFLWRGCIRKGEPMVVGIASKRMYNYLIDWLHND